MMLAPLLPAQATRRKCLFLCLLIGSFSLVNYSSVVAELLPVKTDIQSELAAANQAESTQDGSPQEEPRNVPIKDWNFMVYLAANNNLHRFSVRNIKQMMQVGSTNNINIIAQLDGLNQQEVARFFITKNGYQTISTHAHSQETTSGTVESLYEFLKWSIKNYPARHQAVVLWNHGSGIKDPSIWGRRLLHYRDELFVLNYKTGMLEINRSIPIRATGLTKWVKKELKKRGIAFNDTFETYITNQDMQQVLERVSHECLNDNKIDIVFFDACHMAMTEIGSQIKNAAKYMVASEEVEPGSGYNYQYLLAPFVTTSLAPEQFAQHAVTAYQKEYSLENADYTQSAVCLLNYEKVEDNVKTLTKKLSALLNQEESIAIQNVIYDSRQNRSLCTSFCDPDYIDMCHFYLSVQNGLNSFLESNNPSPTLKNQIEQTLFTIHQGLNMMQNYIIKNASGINLPHAYGLSFYFPQRSVHKSYYKTVFNQETSWSKFLNRFIRSKKFEIKDSDTDSEHKEELKSSNNESQAQ